MQDARSDAETQEDEGAATNGPTKNLIDASTLSLEQIRSPCAVRTRCSLSSIEQSPYHPQPITLRKQDGPPRSSEINATTEPKARRVPTNDNERHTGCFSFFRHGARRRTESGSATKTVLCNCMEHSAEQLYHPCSGNTCVPERASFVKDASSEEFRLADAQGYRYANRRGSSLPSELAKQESSNRFVVDTSSKDWRSLEQTDLTRGPSLRIFDKHSPRSPYDMRHGAVHPHYFASNDLTRENSTQRRASGTIASSSPSYMRSNTTLSTSPSIRRRPLVDLTPQYQPPPQHRHKGHGFYPEQLGSGKLVDYATSLRKESSFP